MEHNLQRFRWVGVGPQLATNQRRITAMSTKPFAFKRAARYGVAGWATGFLVAVFLMCPAAFAAKSDKSHNDAFLSGDVDESRIASQVRHALLMLPYYG